MIDSRNANVFRYIPNVICNEHQKNSKRTIKIVRRFDNLNFETHFSGKFSIFL